MPTALQTTQTIAGSIDSGTTSKRSMNSTIGTSQTSLTSANNVVGATATGNVFVARFISPPINQTSIAANTWNLDLAGYVGNTLDNAPNGAGSTLAAAMPICVYVWRPSTGVRVGFILDGATATFNSPSTQTSESNSVTTFAGAAVTCQVDDVIIVEFLVSVHNGSNACTYTSCFDGTTVTTTNNTAVTNYAAFIETPENVYFRYATRIYLHNTANSTAGLPTTKQSAQTTGSGNATAENVNNNMTTTIGTAQTSFSLPYGSAAGYIYWSRWVSDKIGGDISAQTWTFSFALTDPFGSNDNGVRICIYVWRPSTSTRIGYICDTTVAQAFASSETGYLLTVAGSAVTGTATGDVICVEFMTQLLSNISSPFYYYFDGTTVQITNNTAASNIASYIETPQTLTLGAVSSTAITCTVTTKALQNKFIRKY